MGDIAKKLDTLSPEQIIEAANAVLAPRLNIDDPNEAATKVVSFSGVSQVDPAWISKLAREAAESSPEKIAELLNAIMEDIAESTSQASDTVVEAIETAGEKQTIVGIDVIAIGVLLLVGYLVVKNGGKKEEQVETTTTRGADGGIEVKTSRRTIYINPFESLATLVKTLLPNLLGP